MTRPVHLLWMYGMYGPITDPGSREFVNRVVGDIPNIDVHKSPYRDYDVNQIVDIVKGLSSDSVIFVGGTSLGSNNAPIVAEYAKRNIHGVFGFQASYWGAHSELTKNVLFAHLFYSLNPLNGGLGSYIWKPVQGFDVARFHHDERDLIHPGDGDIRSQNAFLDEMKRIIANPGDGQ